MGCPRQAYLSQVKEAIEGETRFVGNSSQLSPSRDFVRSLNTHELVTKQVSNSPI